MRRAPKIAGVALVAVLATTLNGMTDASATATVTAPGSILYVKTHDVWLTNSTASTTTRITTDGGTATTDQTGGIGYHAPSASDTGDTIVAVRNQHYSPGYDLGWIYVMDRNGAVQHKFRPRQYAFIDDPGSPCPVKADQVPRGILNAVVSPNGTQIAYVAWTYEESIFDCTASTGYMTYVANIDGSGAHAITRPGGDGADLEIGQWLTSTTLLLDDVDFGSTAFWYVKLPHRIAQDWFDAPDYFDAAYGQPALKSRKLASVGYSEYNYGNAMRLWTSGSPPAQPSPQCEYLTDDLAGGAYSGRPSWAPAGAAVVWSVDDNHAAVRAGEGIYVVRVGLTLNCAASPTLLVPGGSDPYWSPAAA